MRSRSAAVLALWCLAACSGDDAAPRQTDPNMLSSRGLYADMGERRVVADAFEYTPDYALWSDGADKRRWLILPRGAVVDIADLAHWDFPLGSKLFKEFSLEGQLLETRLIERIKTTGRVKEDFFMGTFVWRKDQRDAILEKDGQDNVEGTEHDVPAQKYCIVCHRGEASGILGFSAVQLSASGTLHTAYERGLLSDEPTRSYAVPGDDIQRPALGTLHANCGHCHADGAIADFMHLRILPAEVDRPIEELEAYKTSVGVTVSDEWMERPPEWTTRIVPGDPEQSALLWRMQQRGDDALVLDQMPPIATRKVDDEAVAAVRAWIESLPRGPEEVADAGSAQAPDAGATQPSDAGEPDAGANEPPVRNDQPASTMMDAGDAPPTQNGNGDVPMPVAMTGAGGAGAGAAGDSAPSAGSGEAGAAGDAPTAGAAATGDPDDGGTDIDADTDEGQPP